MKHGTFAEGETTATRYDSKRNRLHDGHVTQIHEKKKCTWIGVKKNKHVVLIIKVSLSNPGASPKAD